MHIVHNDTTAWFSIRRIYICVSCFFFLSFSWALFDTEFAYSNLPTANGTTLRCSCLFTLATIGAICQFAIFYIVIPFDCQFFLRLIGIRAQGREMAKNIDQSSAKYVYVYISSQYTTSNAKHLQLVAFIQHELLTYSCQILMMGQLFD